MNPQPEHSTIVFFSWLFVGMVIYFLMTNKNHSNILSNDLVDILYEVEHTNYYNTTAEIKSKPRSKSKPIDKKKPIKIIDKSLEPIHEEVIKSKPIPKPEPLKKKNFTELHNDCVNALMSLGMKKREATNTVINVFQKYKITTIEDFIKKAFVPDEYYRPSN